MQIRTLLRYLIGDRQAILEIAASRWALAVGALFVLSAGLAREYDGEDLLHEPWHLLIPFGASLLSSFLLFCLACKRCDWRYQTWVKFFRAYPSFLGLFWMTAPLAWLYGIPYERFLPPVEAMQANLATLALVATWRVVLMIRVLHVLMNYPIVDAFFTVMLFASWVAVVAVSFSPFPVIEIMGGIRMAGADSVLQQATLAVFDLSCCTGILLFLLFLGTISKSERPFGQPQLPEPSGKVSWSCWVVAIGSVVAWATLLPFTQPEQQLRRRVEQAFWEGQYRNMLLELSAHAPEDFPPHWQPPPRWPRDGQDKLLDIWEEIAERPPAGWVRQVYLDKLRKWLLEGRYGYVMHDNADRFRQLLTKLPEGPGLIDELKQEHQPIVDLLRTKKDSDNKEKQ